MQRDRISRVLGARVFQSGFSLWIVDFISQNCVNYSIRVQLSRFQALSRDYLYNRSQSKGKEKKELSYQQCFWFFFFFVFFFWCFFWFVCCLLVCFRQTWLFSLIKGEMVFSETNEKLPLWKTPDRGFPSDTLGWKSDSLFSPQACCLQKPSLKDTGSLSSFNFSRIVWARKCKAQEGSSPVSNGCHLRADSDILADTSE